MPPFFQVAYTPSPRILVNIPKYRRYASGTPMVMTNNDEDKQFVELVLRALASLAGSGVERDAIGSGISEGLSGLGISRGQASALLALYDAVQRTNVRDAAGTVRGHSILNVLRMPQSIFGELLETEDEVPDIIADLRDGSLNPHDLDEDDDLEFARALLDSDDLVHAMREDEANAARHAINEVINGRGLWASEITSALAEYNRVTQFETEDVREARQEIENLRAELADAEARLARLAA